MSKLLQIVLRIEFEIRWPLIMIYLAFLKFFVFHGHGKLKEVASLKNECFKFQICSLKSGELRSIKEFQQIVAMWLCCKFFEAE